MCHADDVPLTERHSCFNFNYFFSNEQICSPDQLLAAPQFVQESGSHPNTSNFT